MLLSLLLALTGPSPNRDLLVTSDWLAQHQKDPNLVILHVAREKAEFDRGHVPGARFLPARSLWLSTGPGVELPTPAAIDSAIEE